MITIPPQLSTWRFILVAPGDKRPIEKEWQNHADYAFSHPVLAEHLAKGGNYGVKGGTDRCIIDCDTAELQELVEKYFPPTFTILTPGHNGKHYYFYCDNAKTLRLGKGGMNKGDVQGPGKMVIGPGCTHPNGGKYTIFKDLPIAKISVEQIHEVFYDYIDQREDPAAWATHKVNIPIEQVFPINTLKRQGNQFVGSHPIHGSDTGRNFAINTEKNVWYCFRHGTGGDALALLAVLEGIIQCQNCVPGALSGAIFKKVLDAARARGINIPESARLAAADTEEEDAVYTSFVNNSDIIAEEILLGGKAGRAVFAVYNGNAVSYSEKVTMGGKTYYAIPADDPAIANDAVQLPDGVEDYGTVEKLVERIRTHIHKYLDISEEFEIFSAWYILLSWVYDRLNTLVYLRVLGDIGTGKSRYQSVVGGLCYKPIKAAGAITPAPIYRILARWRGTLIIDETDWKDSSEYAEVIKILNCGFEKGNPVIRCLKDSPDNLQILPTFGPKILASRREYYDQALESRCLTEIMKPMTRTDVPVLLPAVFFTEQAVLRRQLLMFRFKYYHKISNTIVDDVDLGTELEPRLKQATVSFAALFKNIPDTFANFKKFLIKYQAELVEKRAATREGMLVEALYEIFSSDIKGKVTPTILAEHIQANKGETLNASQIGRLLRSLKIETKPTCRDGKTVKLIQYNETLFKSLFCKYIPEYYQLFVGHTKREENDWGAQAMATSEALTEEELALVKRTLYELKDIGIMAFLDYAPVDERKLKSDPRVKEFAVFGEGTIKWKPDSQRAD